MASYTIEDIELIRQKSGISYHEAVALLDYHNGNVARALVDLERNGRIKPDAAQKTNTEKTTSQKRNTHGLMNLLSRMYQFRIKVKKEQTVILNLSLLFSIVACLISPHLVVLGLILLLILGYKISFDKRDRDFAAANLERMVRNAGENVRETVSDFTRGFQDGFFDEDAEQPSDKETVDHSTSDQSDKAQPKQADERSYYASNPTSATYHAATSPFQRDVPTIQVPVQVESQDGQVTMQSHHDGYHSATVE